MRKHDTSIKNKANKEETKQNQNKEEEFKSQESSDDLISDGSVNEEDKKAYQEMLNKES